MTQAEKLHFIRLDPFLTRNVDCEHRRAFSSYLVSEGSARVRECRAARPREPLFVLCLQLRVWSFFVSRNLLDRLRKKRDQSARKLRSPKLTPKSQKVISFSTKLIDNKVVYQTSIYFYLLCLPRSI